MPKPIEYTTVSKTGDERGNHDGIYDTEPPQGCIDIDGKVLTVRIPDRSSAGIPDGTCGRSVRIFGLGGSMRYHEGPDMYTEDEMSARVRRLRLKLRADALKSHITGKKPGPDTADIFLTHAPCRGFGDMDDTAHRGFGCFNDLLSEFRPAVHCHGHIHREYGRIRSELPHPSGTRLINCTDMQIIEIP